MRFLLLYLRSRQVPAALAIAVAGAAGGWGLSQAVDRPQAGTMFGLLAVLAGTAAAGTGLAGADIHLDRTAGFWWQPRRAAHLVLASAAIIGLVIATALTGDQLAPAAQVTRNTIGMAGLIALGVATFGAGLARMMPVTWTLIALALDGITSMPVKVLEVLAWMLRPADTAPAAVTAVVLGVTGVFAYAWFGPRPS